jgi:indole-3-glycerol phosphate synthase
MKTLEEIVENKKQEVLELKKKYQPRDFKSIFADRNSIKLIAEIKLASPSEGQMTSLSHLDLAKIYAESSADAISVLTESKYFQGHIDFLAEVKEICVQPILRKDFIIDEYQIFESFIAKADAILLIAAILTQEQLTRFLNSAKSLGLSVLVEIHNETDLAKTLEAEAEIIGINNRDLTTMKIDLTTAEKLVALIPKDKIIISESGINSAEDVRYMKSLGVHGILVGTAIVRSADQMEKIKELKNL